MASASLRETTFAADAVNPDGRDLLKWTGALAGATGASIAPHPQSTKKPEPVPGPRDVGGLRKGMFSYILASEQFPTAELVKLGTLASRTPSLTCCPPATIYSPGRTTKATANKPGHHGCARCLDPWLDGHDGHLPHIALYPRGGGGSLCHHEPPLPEPRLPGRGFR